MSPANQGLIGCRAGLGGTNRLHIVAHQARHVVFAHGPESPKPRVPLGFLAGERAIGCVGPRARVGVHHQHGARLLLQVRQARQQHRVFENVGMIPSMERVAVSKHVSTLQVWRCSTECACTKKWIGHHDDASTRTKSGQKRSSRRGCPEGSGLTGWHGCC